MIVYKRFIILIFISLPFFSFSKNLEEDFFLKINNFFMYLFPKEFVAEIKSPMLDEDIKKIPAIYIKKDEPKLMVYFNQDMGVQLKMLNVAKGISKQYGMISSSLKSFYPFMQSKSYEEFSNNFSIEYISSTQAKFFEKQSSKELYYMVYIDTVGRITFIEKYIGGILDNKIQFFYQIQEGLHTVQLIDFFQKQKESGNFSHIYANFLEYDLNPQLKKEDFLG